MIFALLYFAVRGLFGWVAGPSSIDQSKDVEILVLRHQLKNRSGGRSVRNIRKAGEWPNKKRGWTSAGSWEAPRGRRRRSSGARVPRCTRSRPRVHMVPRPKGGGTNLEEPG